MKKCYCLDCKKEITYQTGHYGKGRCNSCSQIGRIVSKEIREKIRITLTNHFVSEETKRKIKFGNKNTNKGRIPWNKGLTKETDNRIKLISDNSIGKKMSLVARMKMSIAQCKINTKSRSRKIKYHNIWMRSGWEVKFAKFLDENRIKWFYENNHFDLGDCTYTPDFYLPEIDEYIEIKGYWRDDAKLKFDLFKIFYPDKKIIILQEKDLKQLNLI